MSPHSRWIEFGAQLRAVRETANISLRQAELLSGYSKGMHSLVETGCARPGRGLVLWYDGRFKADGALIALYEQTLDADLAQCE